MKIAMAVLFAMFLAATQSWAVLGENANSVETDRQMMRGEVRAVAAQGYSLRQINGPAGSQVKEFVSPDGRVFGVAWQGPFMPNLQQLLGSYFQQFQQVARSQTRLHGPRGPVVLRTDKVVIASGGHMRSFRGMAYVPSLLPKNVPAEVVR
jgi:Protein of unknown function (DUF2844)